MAFTRVATTDRARNRSAGAKGRTVPLPPPRGASPKIVETIHLGAKSGCRHEAPSR